MPARRQVHRADPGDLPMAGGHRPRSRSRSKGGSRPAASPDRSVKPGGRGASSSVLESFGIGSRLQRGKRYAHIGQVLSLDIVPGQVPASVQGSRSKPYRVFIETGILSDSEWGSIEEVVARGLSSWPNSCPARCPRRSRRPSSNLDHAVPRLGRRPRLHVFVPRLGEPVQARGRGLLPDGGSLR